MSSGQFFVAPVGSAIYGISLGLENFSKNVKFFNFFPFRSKKISSGRIKKYPGRVKKYLGQRWVGLFFTGGQK